MAGYDGAVDAEARPASHGSASGARLDALLASAVIPRLVESVRANADAPRPGAAHIDTLARLSVGRDERAATAHVEALRESGVPVESLLNDLIGPAANRLGDFWSCDSADFAEVAIGASRLVQIARALGVEAERALSAEAPRILMLSPETERHGLGGLIVAQSFRAAGWRVTALPGASLSDASDAVSFERYDVVGVSAGDPRGVPTLERMIARVRAASRNRRVLIAAGGPTFAAEPGLAERIGADFTARDARDALARANALLPRAAQATH